ncbi:hypothetical protein CDAR_205661 [Caerostris darwini]|uniref:Uncharacterized protein n=1 Tax=Caerostris darwini TaxID=1538125 RepID=A0AAV4WTR7_9ARAC|nr:hypothetical protein CDAR_205661 [Caerostris darwini]
MTKKYAFFFSNLLRTNVSTGAKDNGEEEGFLCIPYSAFSILADFCLIVFRVESPTYLFPFPIPGCGLLSRVSQNRNCDEVALGGMGEKSKIREIAKYPGEVETLSFENSSTQILKGNGSELNPEPSKKMTKKYLSFCSNLLRTNVPTGAKNNGEEEGYLCIP